MRVRRFILVAAALALGCGSTGGGGGSNLNYTGTPGQPAQALLFSNVLLADLTVDGVAGQRVVVDTGSPVVLLSPASFPGISIPDGSGTVASIGFGGLTFQQPPVLGANLLSSPDPTIPIAGAFGCTILCNFAASFNYRDQQVVLGAGATPANLQPSVDVPFQLEGGGIAQIQGVPGTVPFPPSRITLNANVEGTPHTIVVDTGASFVILRESVYSQITSDGRTQLGGIQATSISGMSTATVTRLKSLVLGAAEVDGVAASADPAFDTLLDGLANEIGRTVDGLVGGTFLREFLVTVDYPIRTLHFARWVDRSFIVDEFERIGVDFGAASGQGYAVGTVFQGTDAASKGVMTGDVIVAIDGQPLASVGPTAANLALAGTVGSTKMVQFGMASAPQLSGQTVAIRVDELLPAP